MARLPETGTVSYNGVDFISVAEALTTSVVARPVPDAAGRTTMYIEYTITVEGVIQSDSNTNSTLETLRRAILQTGGELHYDGRGFGTTSLSVNDSTGLIRDVNWGPKPQMLAWKPIGAENACRFTWQVVTCVPECSGGTSATRYSKALMSVAYKWHVSIDRSGLSKRAVSGMATVATTKSSATATRIQDTADRYREQLVPRPLPGFFRESQEYDVDEAKSTITFSVVDVERPSANVLPIGVIDAEASHEVSSDRQAGFNNWRATLTAKYEMVKGADPTLAWNHFFFGLYKQRRNWARANIKDNPSAVLPASLTVRESDIFGKNIAEFSIGYTYATSWHNFLLASGLWLPVPGNDALWRASLGNSSFHPRGTAKLRLQASDDVIISLCAQPSLLLGQNGGNFQGKYGKLVVQEERVLANSSWLAYVVGVTVEVDDGTVLHLPLGTDQAEPTNNGSPAANSATGRGLQGGGRIENEQLTGGRISSNGIAPPLVGGKIANLQQRPPQIFVWLWGHAVRAGFAITPPTLVKIGGVDAWPADIKDQCYDKSWVVCNLGGLPIVKCEWRHRYFLSEAPTEPIVPPANPMFQ